MYIKAGTGVRKNSTVASGSSLITCRINEVDFSKKKINNRLFCCNHTCYCVGRVSVMSAPRYVTSASRYQSRSSMNIRDLIQRS